MHLKIVAIFRSQLRNTANEASFSSLDISLQYTFKKVLKINTKMGIREYIFFMQINIQPMW